MHDNCGNQDVFEDCRAKVYDKTFTDEDAYDACIDAADDELFAACLNDYHATCFREIDDRYFDVWMDFDCLKKNTCGC